MTQRNYIIKLLTYALELNDTGVLDASLNFLENKKLALEKVKQYEDQDMKNHFQNQYRCAYSMFVHQYDIVGKSIEYELYDYLETIKA